MSFYLYVLYSKEIDKYYVGQTWNLELRELRHNLGINRFTKRAKDWSIVYNEIYKTRSAAVRRETEIKKMKSRKYIVDLILKNK